MMGICLDVVSWVGIGDERVDLHVRWLGVVGFQ